MREPLLQRGRDGGRAGHEAQPCVACRDLDADIRAGFGVGHRRALLQIKRHLAGHDEQLGRNAAGKGERPAERHGVARHDV
jgi:hypothetical protein